MTLACAYVCNIQQLDYKWCLIQGNVADWINNGLKFELTESWLEILADKFATNG